MEIAESQMLQNEVIQNSRRLGMEITQFHTCCRIKFSKNVVGLEWKLHKFTDVGETCCDRRAVVENQDRSINDICEEL